MVEDIKWTYEAAGRGDEIIAIYASGQFLAMPAFSGRVQHSGQGAIVVRHVTLLESGNYSVLVSYLNSANVLTRSDKTVFVQVAGRFSYVTLDWLT